MGWVDDRDSTIDHEGLLRHWERCNPCGMLLRIYRRPAAFYPGHGSYVFHCFAIRKRWNEIRFLNYLLRPLSTNDASSIPSRLWYHKK